MNWRSFIITPLRRNAREPAKRIAIPVAQYGVRTGKPVRVRILPPTPERVTIHYPNNTRVTIEGDPYIIRQVMGRLDGQQIAYRPKRFKELDSE